MPTPEELEGHRQLEASQTMKAIQVHTYGGPEVLGYEDVPRPIAGPGEVLVRVFAAGVNPPDWYIRSGYANIPDARRFPKILPIIPGSDISGIVEEVGPEITAFHKGDAVYGLIRFPSSGGVPAGAYAEYITAPATHLALKPATIDHIQAAAIPMSALTIWQAISKSGYLEENQTVLVNGAAGGLGHFAVQIAKNAGTRVIGVASGRHEAFLSELGVDEFIDYTAISPEKVAHDVDLVIDTVGGENADCLLEVLKPGGVLLSLSLGGYSAERTASASVTIQRMQVHSDGAQLAQIGSLIDAGRLRVAIDTIVPLSEARKAHERGERGHLRGKIVLRVAE